MKAEWCLIVGLLISITWTWGRWMALRNTEFLWPQFLPLHHGDLRIDMKNEQISLLIITVYHVLKTIVSLITKSALPISCFLLKLRLRPALWLSKVISLINIEADIQIQVCLISKTLEVFDFYVLVLQNPKWLPLKIMDEESD